MTRKHFNKIAARLREHAEASVSGDANHGQADLKLLISDLAYDLADTNPNFDRGRFLEAAGYNMLSALLIP